MSTTPELAALAEEIERLRPALETSLDPVAIVDPTGRLVHCSTSMMALLKLRPRELAGLPDLNALVHFSAYDKTEGPVRESLRTGNPVRLDETPAMTLKVEEKLRVIIHSVPLFLRTPATPKKVIGAIVAMRDTSGEVLLQAKYNKLQKMYAAAKSPG